MPVPIHDVNSFILDYLPRTKRKPFWNGWIKGLLSQMDRLNKLFNDFRNGSTDLGYWSNIVTYQSGDKVRTLNGVFESILGGNIGNNPITDDGTKWLKVLDDFIGSEKRISFTVQKLSLEFALNERFQGVLNDNGFTGFKQPTSIDAGIGYLPLSDIYLEYYTSTFTSFVSYPDAIQSSISYPGSSTDFVFPVPSYSSFTSYIATVFIPSSVFSALGTPDVATSVVMNFINKIKRFGTSYIIQVY